MTATSAAATTTRSLSSAGRWVSSYNPHPQDPSDVSSPAYVAYRMTELIAIGKGAPCLQMSLRLIIQEYTRSHYSFMPKEANDEAAKRKVANAYQIDPRKVEALQRNGLQVLLRARFYAFKYFQEGVAILDNRYIFAKTSMVTETCGEIGIEVGDMSSSDPKSKTAHRQPWEPITVGLLNEYTGVCLTRVSFIRIHLKGEILTKSYPLKSSYLLDPPVCGLLNSQRDRLYIATDTACASYDPHSNTFEKRANFGAFFGALPRGEKGKFLLTDGDMVITIQTQALQETILTAFQVGKRDKGEDEVIEVSRFSFPSLKVFYFAHLVDIGEIALSTNYLQNEMTSVTSLEGSILRFGPPVSQNIQTESVTPWKTAPAAPAFVTQELLNLVDELMKNEAVKKDVSLLKALQEKHAEIKHVYPSRDLSNANAVFFNLARTLLDAKGAIKKDIREELLKKE